MASPSIHDGEQKHVERKNGDIRLTPKVVHAITVQVKS